MLKQWIGMIILVGIGCFANAQDVELRILKEQNETRLEWSAESAVLETTPSLRDDWTDAEEQSSPYLIPAESPAQQYFRLRIESGEIVMPIEDVELGIDSTVQIPLAFDGEGDVEWTSSNEAVAEVDTEGNVTAIGEGETSITAARMGDGTVLGQVDVTVREDPVVQGVRIAGDPAVKLADAAFDLDVVVPLSEDEIGEDARGEILLTEIEIALIPDISLGEFNELLDELGGRVVSMLENLPLIVVRIPQPENIAVLGQIIEDLEGRESVEFVAESLMVPQEEVIAEDEIMARQRSIPDNADLERIEHHLAVRAHGAWNVSDALPSLHERPWVVIGDLFGKGEPGILDAELTQIDFHGHSLSTGSEHGYHVAGIIAAPFNPTVEGLTGIFPKTLRIRGVDFLSPSANTVPRFSNQIIRRIKSILVSDPGAQIVVNTSWGHDCGTSQFNWALSWMTKVRGGSQNLYQVGSGLEHRFIHFVSAGNLFPHCGVAPDVFDVSPFTHAALGDVFDYPKLSNTLVIENRASASNELDDSQRPVPVGVHASSVTGGHLSAIGTDVWSLARNSTGFSDTGSSQATPQAAGAAAYAWALAPDLTVPEVVELMMNSAEEIKDGGPPVIDAFAAVLEAGGEEVRRTLLDVDGNGSFDEADIADLLEAFKDDPSALNYGRRDLNASGHVGSLATERFDLDMDGEHTMVSQTIEDQVVTYDERAATDLDILCYCAYSSLYDGDPEARSELLKGHCIKSATIQWAIPADDFPLEVGVFGSPAPGGFMLVPQDRQISLPNGMTFDHPGDNVLMDAFTEFELVQEDPMTVTASALGVVTGTGIYFPGDPAEALELIDDREANRTVFAGGSEYEVRASINLLDEAEDGSDGKILRHVDGPEGDTFEVRFEGRGSIESQAPQNTEIVSYSWTFNNGESPSGEIVTTTFPRDTSFISAELTVTDNHGNYATMIQRFIVVEVTGHFEFDFNLSGEPYHCIPFLGDDSCRIQINMSGGRDGAYTANVGTFAMVDDIEGFVIHFSGQQNAMEVP